MDTEKIIRFIAWLHRYNPTAVERFVHEQHIGILYGKSGVWANPESTALLSEAFSNGILPIQNQNGTPLESNGAVNSGDSSAQ